jgi:hypothetical protein
MAPLRRAARRAALLLIFALSLLGTLTDSTVDVAAQRIDAGARKVIVDSRDPAALAELTRQGGTLLVDYGALSLWSMPGASAGAVRASTSLRLQDVGDTIGLRGGRAIETAARGRASSAISRPADTASTQEAAATGKQLWLAQFIGPIKESWLADLRRDGLSPVIYMAPNAYVVWGDDAARARLDMRARRAR